MERWKSWSNERGLTTLENINNEFYLKTKIVENTEVDILNIKTKRDSEIMELKLIEDAKLLLETLKVYKLKEKKDFILNIINTALVDIFQSDIKISIEPQEKKSMVSATQKFDIIFYQNGHEMARNDELLITNGGGIMQVVSMLFKLLIGYIYSKNTFYIFDESFSQLSSDNRIRLSKFIQEFCKKFKFTIVVVSQVIDLDEYADIVYSVDAEDNEAGVRTMVLKDTTIKEDILERDFDTEGFWKINVRNFQSIVDTEMIFKGYTIIRGPNNSGKSAYLRALNSILYNSFNVKKYPRRTGVKNKVLHTDILLTKVRLNSEKSIGLRFKTNKVSFLIDNDYYYGKNLAAGKLQEKVEELGFKYINLKEFYKNFKGNLKDQTERISSTNQYDSLFLVGAKGNETEKIFNFLFNTESISLGINKLKEEIVLKNQDIMKGQEQLMELDKRLIENIQDKDILIRIYYLKGIKDFKTSKFILREKEFTKMVAIDKLEKVINIVNRLSKFKNEKILGNWKEELNNFSTLIVQRNSFLVNIENSIYNINTKISNVKETVLKINELTSKLVLSDYIKELKKPTPILNISKLTIVDKILDLCKSRDFNASKILSDNLIYFKDLENGLTKLQSKKDEIEFKILDLKNQYPIKKCPHCNGAGYIEDKG